MKKPSDEIKVQHLIGLGTQSARKSYYPELVDKIAELEAERNRYKWLFENALHGIFQANLEGEIQSANRALGEVCGYHSMGENLGAAKRLDQDLFYRIDDYQAFYQELVTTNKVSDFVTELKRQDGSRVHVMINALLRLDGEAPLIEAFVKDITDRVLAQKALTQANEELEERVRRRTRALVDLNTQLTAEIEDREKVEVALKQAKEQAEAANHSKDKYLAAASHDLLQPMNAARLLVATLAERKLGKEEAYLVSRVHLALEGAEDLLTDLLEISKLDQNAVSADMSALALSSLLSSLKSDFEPVASSEGLELHVQDSKLCVCSDSRLLMRILRNLVSNAIRYTLKGRVLVGCRPRGDKVLIQVWDSGIGIDQAQLGLIFKEFHQLENVAAARKGVGLGLAIVERIASVLGHRLHVASVEGKGSVFSVEVPRAALAEVEYVPVATVTTGSITGLRVLVLDNDPNILESMQALLEQWDCRVFLAKSREDALAIEEPFSLVLADYHLDDGDTGVEAVLALRERWPDLTAVMLTAERGDDFRAQAAKLNAQVLNKPVRPGRLRAVLQHSFAQGKERNGA